MRVITLDKNYKFTRDVAYRSETRKNNGKKKDDDDDEGKKRLQGNNTPVFCSTFLQAQKNAKMN